MEFALVKNGAVEIAAVELATLAKYLANTTGGNISLPDNPQSPVDIGNGYLLHPVTPVSEAMPDGKTLAGLFDYALSTDGVTVERRVTLRDMTPQELARAAKNKDKNDAREELKLNAFIAAFPGMSPQQLRAHILANSNTDAKLRELVTDLAQMVLVLMKGESA